MGPIDLTMVWGKKSYQFQWGPTILKLSSFVFSRRKKYIQVGNNSRVSK